MKGYRTLLLNLAAAVLPVLQGLDVTALGSSGMAVYAGVLAIANIGLRLLTTTPVGVK